MNIDKHIKLSLLEDDCNHDITTKLIPRINKSKANLISKESFYIYGLNWFERVFKQVDNKVKVKTKVNNGDFVKKNEIVAYIYGCNHSILKSERVALNYLQVMSGVYDLCIKYRKKLKNNKIKILHTRKTPPLLRLPVSEACSAAKCLPHRYSLSSSVLLKENHLVCVSDPIKLIKDYVKKYKQVIVEAKTIRFAKSLEGLGIERVLLDNFKPSMIKSFLKLNLKLKIELSGSINLSNIDSYLFDGVDYISIGSLTKNIVSKDLSILIQ